MKIHILDPKLAEYRIMPQVVLTGREFDFTVRGLGIETNLTPGADYLLRIIPQEEIGTARSLCIGDENIYDEIVVTANENSLLHFSYAFAREQIYTVRLIDGEKNRLVDFKIFSAKADLWERTPMRGNSHCHVCKSVDGHEDPVVAASIYRKAGYDYLAITDHHNIEGSSYAVEHMRSIPTEMSLFYGEEVHVPNAYLHIVNVGAVMPGGIGIDMWYHDHEDEINSEVDMIAAEHENRLPEGVETYDFAWRKWIADTIHKNGGVAIIAHPFWEYDAHNTPNAMLEYLIRTKLFDAVEIVHGQDDPDATESNRQAAFWNDLRADGAFISVVGCDDAHCRSYKWNCGCDFNHAYTLIFANDPSFDGFAEAVTNGYSVAVESYGGAPEHVIGTYRFTRFAFFLLERYYPFHDELCFEEGCRIKDAYLGDSDSLKVLELINGRVRRFTNEFFGRGEV